MAQGNFPSGIREGSALTRRLRKVRTPHRDPDPGIPSGAGMTGRGYRRPAAGRDRLLGLDSGSMENGVRAASPGRKRTMLPTPEGEACRVAVVRRRLAVGRAEG
jgi:hypothetical protein